MRLSLGLESRPYMKHQEVDNYLIAVLSTCETACKIEKGKLLDHGELITKRSSRPLMYLRAKLIPHIKFLWMQMEKISVKPMKATMPHWP